MTSPSRKVYSGAVAGTKVVVSDKQTDIRSITMLNTTAAVAYLQVFFLPTASVTVGTTAPDLSIGLPASGGAVIQYPEGLSIGTGLVIAGTTLRTNATGAQIDTNIVYN